MLPGYGCDEISKFQMPSLPHCGDHTFDMWAKTKAYSFKLLCPEYFIIQQENQLRQYQTPDHKGSSGSKCPSQQAEKPCWRVFTPAVDACTVTFQKAGCLILLNVEMYQLTGIPTLNVWSLMY